jgi:hypothetical protein
MKTMDIIFNDEDYYDELLRDIGYWCKTHGIPVDRLIVGMDENNVDDIDYFVIIVNQTIFSYLMFMEFEMSEQYGRGGWNRMIESDYNCETA